MIWRSKADPEGDGSVAYLAPHTVQYVRTWLGVAGIQTGARFQRIIEQDEIIEGLGADSIYRHPQTGDEVQTARWKDARIVQRYGKHLLAGRGAMARAAQAQGRLEIVTSPKRAAD